MRTDMQHRQRGELADVIDRRSQDIVDRWLAQVSTDAAVARVTLTELQDGIRDYLKRLAELMRSDQPLSGVAVSAWSDIAREHAITRVRLGFDVTQLFHELVVLRQITHRVLDKEGFANSTEDLQDLIDAAIGASIKSYVDYRDYLTRRTEAEHIGFLTHELRNPLAAAAMAAEQLRSAPESSREHLLDILDRGIDRLRRMLEEVLLTERLQIGEVESHPVDLSLGPLIGDALERFRQAAHDKGIAFDDTHDPEMRLHVDPTLTLSALENLLDNAIKYTDEGMVTLVVEDRADEIVFHVRDRCDGIGPEELRVIFEPFRRAHSGKPGSGLGLAIARRAVEAQGGTIHAESSSETGCHFWFTLPKTQH